ncbi:MAG: hypothetical protein KDA17_02715 [Candidatus Saccharibacteria bacterium]|nr:hypothetical protein [Candidatus Saccharibacteria bacterium]
MLFLEVKSGFGYFTLGDSFIHFELFFEATYVLLVSFLGVLGQILEAYALGQRLAEPLSSFFGLMT